MEPLQDPKDDAAKSGLARDLVLAALLFAGAFGLRYARILETIWGDEALYYYLARTWGLDRGWVDVPDNTAAQVAFRPAFFALYLPVAQFGLHAVRACNALVGCGIVSGVFIVSRCLGASRAAATLAGIVVAIHPQAARFSSIFFPDTTMTAFAVGALGCLARGRRGLAGMLMSVAVLSKEVGVVLAAGILAAAVLELVAPAGASSRRLTAIRAELPKLWPLLVPFAAFATTQFLGIVAFHGRMQGWSHNPLSTAYLSNALVGPLFIPVAVTLALKQRWLPLASALALPMFYLAWATIGGRGVEGWYQVSMIPFAAIACACASADWVSALPAARNVRAGNAMGVAVALLPALSVPWSAWLRGDWMPWTKPGPDQLGAVAKALQKHHPQHIALVSCFWAFAYYPLRSPGARVTRWFPDLDGPGTVPEAPTGVRDAGVAVLCNRAAESYRVNNQAANCTLLSTPDYELIRDPHRCLALRASNSKQAPAGSGSAVSRKYTSKEMRVDACVKRRGATLEGRGCSSGIAIFGPYEDASSKASVELRFRIKTDVAAKVSVDVVSDLGQRSYGGTSLDLEADEPRDLRYRVTLPDDAHGLEARVAVSGGARFQLDKFVLEVSPQ